MAGKIIKLLSNTVMRVNKAILSIWMVVFIVSFPAGVFAEDFSNLPLKGMATMIDLGAKKCIPCKMMAPIMKKMETAYKGKAHIVFIDVWENRDQAPGSGKWPVQRLSCWAYILC